MLVLLPEKKSRWKASVNLVGTDDSIRRSHGAMREAWDVRSSRMVGAHRSCSIGVVSPPNGLTLTGANRTLKYSARKNDGAVGVRCSAKLDAGAKSVLLSQIEKVVPMNACLAIVHHHNQKEIVALAL
jgi:hypothetical protein